MNVTWTMKTSLIFVSDVEVNLIYLICVYLTLKFSLKIEKFQEVPQVGELMGINNEDKRDTQEAKWI